MIMRSVLFAFVMVIASGLHVSSHKSNIASSNHKPTVIDLTHTQQALSPQPSLQAHLDMLSNQLSQLQLSHMQISNLQQIQVIDNYGKVIKCKNVSQEDQANLNYALQHLTTDMWSTYFDIERLSGQGGQMELFETQYQQIKQRKQRLEKNTFSFCPQPKTVQPNTIKITNQDNSFADISNNKAISNLDANQYWTYGNITQQQYQINRLQFIMANDVMRCSDDMPFQANGQCIACKDGQIYFLDISICSTCPNATVFNNRTHMCVNQSNLNCKTNQVFNTNSKKCECPSGLPYFNGAECVGCYIPKYWNNQTKSCESCSSGSYYSIINGSCLQCSDQNNFVSSFSSCHDECTLQKPNYDGEKCMKCAQIFNPETKKCESCPKGSYYNKDKGICEQTIINIYPSVDCSKGYIFNRQNGQCIKEPPCYCPSNYIYNASTTKCQCPQNTPYDTGVKCISCQSPRAWDSVSKQCVVEESFINPQSIDKVPVVDVQNIPDNITDNMTDNATTIKQCGNGEVWNNVSQTCDCMSQTPYRTLGGQCVRCLPPNQWSQTLRQCLPPAPTCKSNFIFDPSTQQCICPKAKPFSNGKQCKSCYLPMYWSYTQKRCKYCPVNEYFNPLSRSCEFCPSQRPVLVNHVCQACQRGTAYNKESYRCESITCHDGAVYSQQINDCYCPDRLKPFYNGQQCVACMPPHRWDISSRSCVYDNIAYGPSSVGN